MGKRKIVSEPDELDQMVEPGPGDVYGVVSKMYGYDRLLVDCADGKQRICRIRGQLKRRIWIKEGIWSLFPRGISSEIPAAMSGGGLHTTRLLSWPRKASYLIFSRQSWRHPSRLPPTLRKMD
jgi:hypothetical protein